MQFRPFTSIQVALGAYVYLFACPLPTFTNSMHAWMDGRMDGYSRWMDLRKHNHLCVATL